MSSLYSIVNQDLLPQETASLLVKDLSIQRGYGVFDFLKLVNGNPVFIDDHLARFFYSAAEMRLEILQTPEELKELIYILTSKNNLPDSGIRMTLTGGYSPDGFNLTKPNLVITQQVLKHKPDSNGVRLITYPHQRQFPHVKTIDYLMAVWLRKYIFENNSDDVLYYQNEDVTECPRANFFIVDQNDRIITPARNILKGVIRKNILALAASGYRVLERKISKEEISQAKEAFITSTTKNILPVIAVDGYLINDGSVGEITKALQWDLNKRILN